jgi:hypothetical protein
MFAFGTTLFMYMISRSLLLLVDLGYSFVGMSLILIHLILSSIRQVPSYIIECLPTGVIYFDLSDTIGDQMPPKSSKLSSSSSSRSSSSQPKRAPTSSSTMSAPRFVPPSPSVVVPWSTTFKLLTSLSSLSHFPAALLSIVVDYSRIVQMMIVSTGDPPTCHALIFEHKSNGDSYHDIYDGTIRWQLFHELQPRSASIISSTSERCFYLCNQPAKRNPKEAFVLRYCHLSPLSSVSCNDNGDQGVMPSLSSAHAQTTSKTFTITKHKIGASVRGSIPTFHHLVHVDSTINNRSYIMAVATEYDELFRYERVGRECKYHSILDLSCNNDKGWIKVPLYGCTKPSSLNGKRPNIVVVYGGKIYCWCTLAINWGGSAYYTIFSSSTSSSSSSLLSSTSTSSPQQRSTADRFLDTEGRWRPIALPPFCSNDRPPKDDENTHWSHAVSLSSSSCGGILLLSVFNYTRNSHVACIYNPLNDCYRILQWSIPFTWPTFEQSKISHSSNECQVAYLNGYLVMLGHYNPTGDRPCYILNIESLLNTTEVGVMQLPDKITIDQWRCIPNSMDYLYQPTAGVVSL